MVKKGGNFDFFIFGGHVNFHILNKLYLFVFLVLEILLHFFIGRFIQAAELCVPGSDKLYIGVASFKYFIQSPWDDCESGYWENAIFLECSLLEV